MKDSILVKGARVHNLKNVDLKIPKNRLVVFTGVSGSGKSSLAFDTIYAEGQRRYVESLSTYARQFLGLMEKPDVDLIEGLSPAISIDQKTTSRNPRSSVGTVTEIYDYLRLLFARIGHPHCPVCGREIESQSVDQIVTHIQNYLAQALKSQKTLRFLILSPLVNDKKGEFSNLFDNLKAKGFKRVRIDGQVRGLSEDLYLIKTNRHTIEAEVDRLSLSAKEARDKVFLSNLKTRLFDSVEQALKLSEGLVVLGVVEDKGFELPNLPKEFSDHLYSQKFACPVDNIQLPEIEPRSFSFNTPHGACPKCTGIGKILKIDEELIISPDLTIMEGGVLPLANMFEHDTWYKRLLLKVFEENNLNPRLPISKLSKSDTSVLLGGTGERVYKVEGTNRFGKETAIYQNFEGVIPYLERRHSESDSEYVRASIERYMREIVCSQCQGARLKSESLSVTVDGLSIFEVTSLSIDDSLDWVRGLMAKTSALNEREKNIANFILKEIAERLTFLASVGLNYLTLAREAGTLSGGEAQRIRLASQIGSGLTGVLYVLDEPTIGLHQKDNQKLIKTLKRLKDLGNTVIVVEHDREMIESSDTIVDFGPLAGKRGGEVVFSGTLAEIKKSQKSLTGQFLSGKRKIRLTPTLSQNGLENKFLKLIGCTKHNLKAIDVSIPLGKLVAVTGVSGSGKSSLLTETVYPALKLSLGGRSKAEKPAVRVIQGVENIDKVILIDQSPIGRTPRSNPATYTKVFDEIREVFALTREAKALGFKKGRFSFNVRGGRCEACDGQGQIKIEMQFMSDLWVKCDVCHGGRYNSQTLEVSYKGKNIKDVLAMTVDEALEFFHANPKIVAKLETLARVGLNYMELGQPATTLSGGEAQRVKLSAELSKKDTGNTVYILDEPTTGLHFADLEKLLNVLKLLVAKGNSVLVIEHNLDVVKNADWVIDLGPEGGEKGGKVVAEGTIQEIKKAKNSYTSKYLS